MLREFPQPLDATFDPTRLSESWDQLMRLAPAARASWLESIATADPGIAQALRSRLDGLGAMTSAGDLESESNALESMPRRFGNFVLIKRIGVGGMGEVWLADQDHPRRQVALKLIRGGLISDDAGRRFAREATLASRAEHPSIARIYEAGNVSTPQGTMPYLAMEYVVGESLRDYLQSHRPAARERLRLLAVIAEAVHHAHVRGVVHRDLKPQNILITAQGIPKVLDFGVARALEDATPGATRMTEVGQLVGTLAYMSPEQLAGDSLAVDARSDVYALGVIAYEALSGTAPFKVGESSILEAIQARARQRPQPLGQAHPSLRGDIELIVMKALAEEPDQRYQTAHEFAEDIGRFLSAQPIRARAPTRSYLWSRFVRRNRIQVFAAGLVLAAILVGAIVSLQFALAESAARREAELRTAKAEAVTAFLHNMLANADPTKSRSRDLKLAEVLQSAADTLEQSPPAEPQVEAGIRGVLVEVFRNLGDFEAALEQVAAGQAAARRGYAADAVESLDLDRMEAAVLLDLERVDLAAQRLDALGGRSAAIALTPELALGVAIQRARVDMVRGNFDAALAIMDRALGDVALPRQHPLVLTARGTRQVILSDLGRFADAEAELNALIADKTALHGADHPSVMRLRADLAVVYDGQGKATEAEAILREVLIGENRVLGADNVESIATSMNLIKLLIERKAFDEAEPLLDHAIAVQTKLFGDDHDRVRLARNMRAVLFEERGAPDQAQNEYQAIIASYARNAGVDHPEALVARNNLAKLYLTRGKYAQAVSEYAAVVAAARNKLGNEHFYTAIFLGNYGDALRQAGDPGAIAVLEEARARCTSALGAEHERTLKVSEWLVQARADSPTQ